MLLLLKECPSLVSCNKELYQFNGRCFDLLTDEFLMQVYQNFIRNHGIMRAWTRRRDVMDSFRVLKEIPVIDSFNDYPNMMCIENGILDLYSRTVIPHTHSMHFDSYIKVTYDPNNQSSSCPAFMHYLNDTFNGDEETINNIIRLGGYLLDTSCKAGKMFLFDGPGGSGKSTLIDTFSMFFNKTHDNTNQVTAMSLEELASGSFDKEDLINSRVNFAAETKKGYLDAEELKKIVTGDLIKVSRKLKRAITFVPKTKIVGACNGLPKFTDTSDGIFRRLILFSFTNQYRTQEEINLYKLNTDLGYKLVDFNLMDKIRSEKDSIFNLFLNGLMELKASNYQFILTNKFVNAIQDFRKDSDTVREFLEDNYVVDRDVEISSTDVYNHFRAWYRTNVADSSYLKLRSAEIGKRIKEVFNLSSCGRKCYFNAATSEWEKPYVYNLSRIIHKKEEPVPPPLENHQYD